MSSLIDDPGLFLELANLVATRKIRTLVESGTGPASSGMEAAKRLGLHGYTCDVYEPCVVRAFQLYPEFDIYHADSLGMLRDCLPKISGPTFFWLDGHCPTDPACAPGPVFPLYDELLLIKEQKRGYERDVLWLDDVSMIADPANPTALEWDVFLGATGEHWYGEKAHSWDDYLAVFADTHDAEVVGSVLRLTPKS